MRLLPICSCVLVSVVCVASSNRTVAAPLSTLAPNGNILSPSDTFASDPVSGSFTVAQALDGKVTSQGPPQADNGLIFSGSETFNAGSGNNPQRFAITGFNSPLSQIWLYVITTDTLRMPSTNDGEQILIKSSTTSTTSLNAGDYATTLLPLTGFPTSAFSNTPVVVDPVNDPARSDSKYLVIPVNAPAGTQSLFFDFDGDGNGVRIQEVQAFAPVPEPGSVVLILIGGVALCAVIRARRLKRGCSPA
jgi:hypothetical protein